MKRIILVVLMVTMLAVSCGSPPSPEQEGVGWTHISGALYRIIDVEAGVVCYIDGGIFCLPIDQTRLRVGK